MKTLLVIPMALLLALSVVPAWAKSDNGNGNGQVKGAPRSSRGCWPSCAPSWRRYLLDCAAEKKGQLNPRMIAEQLFAPPRTKDKQKQNFSNRSRRRAMR